MRLSFQYQAGQVVFHKSQWPKCFFLLCSHSSNEVAQQSLNPSWWFLHKNTASTHCFFATTKHHTKCSTELWFHFGHQFLLCTHVYTTDASTDLDFNTLQKHCKHASGSRQNGKRGGPGRLHDCNNQVQEKEQHTPKVCKQGISPTRSSHTQKKHVGGCILNSCNYPYLVSYSWPHLQIRAIYSIVLVLCARCLQGDRNTWLLQDVTRTLAKPACTSLNIFILVTQSLFKHIGELQ